MRKLILFFTISLFATGLLVAQETSVGVFKGGVRAGLTASQISGDNLTGFHKPGAIVGVFANCTLTDDLRSENRKSKNINVELPDKKVAVNPKSLPVFLSLQMELDFAMKGSHATPKQAGVYGTGKYTLDLGYVEIPLFLKLCFGNVVEIELPGPVFGVNLYKRERDMYGPIQGRPNMKWYEFSFMAGLSWMIRGHHGLNVRYYNSVLPVRKPNWAVHHPIQQQYNSVLTFCYFYQF
ncbi:MAG: hypothetical protein IK013_07240 [Bacteroidales bacterium]|nr:hypothetical protein [Bacteroidales bacterium]